MKFYSAQLVNIWRWPFLKMKGAIALYRFRSLIKGVGKASRCSLSVEIKYPENITIGDHVVIGPHSTIGAFEKVTIENYVRISKGVVIESAGLNLQSPLPYDHKGKPIFIREGAWLGARCIILGGVTIGKGAVIGAGAVVTKNVPDFSIVVSQPIRFIGGPGV